MWQILSLLKAFILYKRFQPQPIVPIKKFWVRNNFKEKFFFFQILSLFSSQSQQQHIIIQWVKTKRSTEKVVQITTTDQPKRRYVTSQFDGSDCFFFMLLMPSLGLPCPFVFQNCPNQPKVWSLFGKVQGCHRFMCRSWFLVSGCL